MKKHLPKIIPFLILGLLFALQIQGKGKTTNEETTMPPLIISPVASDKTAVPTISKQPQIDNAAIKIEKCKIEAQAEINKVRETVLSLAELKNEQCVKSSYEYIIQQQDLTYRTPAMSQAIQSICHDETQNFLTNLKSEMYDTKYLECLSR